MGVPIEERLAPTLTINYYLLKEKVDIIRVHDVQEHVAMRQLAALL